MTIAYDDLRDFIDSVDSLGGLKRVDGADPYLEIGAITEVGAGLPECPAILFDNIVGYPSGYRIFTNATVSASRAALALGLDPRLPPIEALKAWKHLRTSLTPIEPVQVSTGPVLENAQTASAVNLSLFPAPHWHAKDGGPYIGSGSLVIMRDLDTGWINASIYRVQVHGRDRLTIQFDHAGRHGNMIARKYWDRDQSCPVAVVSGEDPALFIAGFEYLPEGRSEYAFAGSIKGRPIEVLSGPLTGMPLPAKSEMIMEGHLLPPSELTLPEGPFGEFTGYYATDARPAPVMIVEAIHHRTNPILLGSPPMKPPRFHFGLPFRAAGIWSDLEAAGVSDVVGAWQHVSQLMTVVAIQQRYAGHAKRAALIAAANSYMGRLIVVVDEDVDPSNLADVMWAVTTRAEPSESVDIVRDAWSSALDPRIPDSRKMRGITSHSKMIIDACKPFGWRNEFPPSSALSPSEALKVKQKWFA